MKLAQIQSKYVSAVVANQIICQQRKEIEELKNMQKFALRMCLKSWNIILYGLQRIAGKSSHTMQP